jgi:hypothetical protein
MALFRRGTVRVFKTAWFSKTAKKARVGDAELCEAIHQVLQGQADNLGGGVFKKRLNRNLYRAIILAKAGQLWVYEYMFAKRERANIDDAELAAFRQLAKSYAVLTDPQIACLIEGGDFTEICHADQAPV